MSKTVILVCAHKQDACLKTPPYQPVQVGRAISQTELPFAVGDDTGDNISDRNRHYCELTAHYWAWKNLHDADYIGLNHYRRYFDFEGGSACSLRTVRSEAFFSASHPVPDFDRLFSRCDIVMARPKIYPYNLYTDYCKCHIESDLLTARQVIAEKYPAYLPDFDPGVLPQQPPLALQHVRPAARAVRGLLGMAVRYSVRGGTADRDSGRPCAGTRDGVFERTVALGMGPAQPAEDLLQNRSDGQ